MQPVRSIQYFLNVPNISIIQIFPYEAANINHKYNVNASCADRVQATKHRTMANGQQSDVDLGSKAHSLLLTRASLQQSRQSQTISRLLTRLLRKAHLALGV